MNESNRSRPLYTVAVEFRSYDPHELFRFLQALETLVDGSAFIMGRELGSRYDLPHE
jgi:hypothetical protein